MLKSMSIRRKFVAFGGLMALIALIIGAIGYWGIARQTDELGGVVTTSSALRNHLESDMMHDALRADVLATLRAAWPRCAPRATATRRNWRKRRPTSPTTARIFATASPPTRN